MPCTARRRAAITASSSPSPTSRITCARATPSTGKRASAAAHPTSRAARSRSVAISDVAHCVREGDAIDIDARERGTSVYFPRRVIPMLPEELSNELCSLKQAGERHVMVCETRVTSVYFPASVIQMLPEELSNELCSLKPAVDRLCMVCDMDVTAEGDING